jgi:hypothetical protein
MNVQLAGGSVGGLVQGAYGNYAQAADGTFTVDARDAPSLLALGMNYIRNMTTTYNTPMNPGIATLGQIIASGALSNGPAAIAHQPDAMRQVNIVVGAGGATAVTAGNVAVTYLANDGTTQTDNISAVVALSASTTTSLSKGVAHINTVVIGGILGGASPYIRGDTTAALAVPIAPNSVDINFFKETVNLVDEAIGSVVGLPPGCITPTTNPSGAVGAGSNSFSFGYAYVAPAA